MTRRGKCKRDNDKQGDQKHKKRSRKKTLTARGISRVEERQEKALEKLTV